MKKKNGTKICAMMLVLVFIVQVGAGASTRQSHSKHVVGDELSEQRANASQVIDLDGSITANVCNGSGGILKGLVYPTIDMPGEQPLSINTSKVNGSWDVNATLRIKVNKPGMTNKTYLIPRCLMVFAVVIRKNQPLISGLLRDLILGKKMTRINVFSDGSSDYVEIPLVYKSKKQDEEQRIFILAIGSLIGVLTGAPPIFVMKTVDLDCHYSNASVDVIPPVTTIKLDGIVLYDKTYEGVVRVSFLSSDEESMVVHTSYEYKYITHDDVYESGWSTDTAPGDFLAPGQYDFSFYSEDSSGNVESIKTESFNIV